ncbi:MAG TPA: beta-ketoacyl synthase N-terminal-like domain-containing protein [Thermoanaerobaculia bacterium]|nr:beta-ketoacyl synthase N-terminal-like domain-containing protein [Thermoanaerobaculia bacterium]
MNGNDSQAVAVVGVSRRASDAFDAASFGFSPREAEALGPVHRAFLQHAREAFQDAGGEAGETWGVYAGGGGDPAGDAVQPELEAGRFHGMLGGDADYLATRVSFKLGLTGPSLTVTGGGAAPLAAVHLACESLLAGEVDAALAGGAEGAVALRRLGDVLAGERSIRAVIRSSTLHHDGTLGGVDRPGLEELLRRIRNPAPRWVVAAASPGGLNARIVLEEPPR